MSPYRAGGRGTLILDRCFKAIGRIYRASGTHDERVWRSYNDLLTELDRNGRVDILRGIRDGVVHVKEVYRAFLEHGLARLPTIERAKLIQDTIDCWTPDIAPKTMSEYQRLLRKVTKGENCPLSELPDLLRRFRESARPRTFNLARSACQSLLRDAVTRYHPLWQAVSAIKPKPLRRSEGHPLPPEEAKAVARGMGKYGAMWWTMCCSGMGPTEYWGEWEILDDRLVIHGTKRAARERFVPRIATPIRPLVLYPAFRRALPDGLRPYDARRTFAHWMEMAGIPDSRAARYMGHAIGSVLRLYQDHSPEYYLAGDTARLRDYIGQSPHRLTVMK